MTRSKKQHPAKRKYTKKTAKLVKPDPVDEELDTELKLLALMCSVLDNWTPEQKKRNLQFINSKYLDYL
jgi:hypothetical protein